MVGNDTCIFGFTSDDITLIGAKMYLSTTSCNDNQGT